tara:strand:+ start:298 stop:645 length:348 start_codon:yes stop_codon:yes gene_type:complete
MKKLIYFALTLILISIQFSHKIYALENEASLEKSQAIIINKYAERFCSAKADNFFEGLDNEKTLKYSYFNYIGLKNEEIFSKEFYEALIYEIKEKCNIKEEEEEDIKKFYELNKN